MTSLLTVTPSPVAAPPWCVDMTPGAFSEPARVQLVGMPGVEWVKRKGCFRAPIEAARIVCATLESAGVCKVEWNVAADRGTYYGGGTCEHISLTAGLRDYQLHGAAWLVHMLRTSGGALLADEMGLGKTPQTIAALDALDAPVIVVVCPAIVVGHWLTQIAKWSHGTAIAGGVPLVKRDALSPAALAAVRWHVYSYERFALAMKKRAVPTARAMAIDEVHYLANHKSLRSQAVATYLAESRKVAPINVIGLSGTPIPARVTNLWHPLELLWPSRFGNLWKFQGRYCAGHYEEIKGIGRSVWVAEGTSLQAELAVRLDAVMLRRTKSQVALELPALTRQVVEVPMTPKATKELAHASAAMANATDSRLTIASLLSAVEAHKLDAAIDLAREVIAGGGRPLLLTLRKESAATLGRALLSPVVDGDTPPGERRGILQADGAPAGVATLYSVTTGIDLTDFDTVIMVGLDWLPTNMLQGEARAHRIGQLRPVTVYYMVGIGTLDEAVRERVIDRLDVFATLTGGDATGGFATTLRGGTEDELLAAMLAAVMAA